MTAHTMQHEREISSAAGMNTTSPLSPATVEPVNADQRSWSRPRKPFWWWNAKVSDAS